MADEEDQMDMNELKSILEELPKVVVRRVNALKNQSLKYVEAYKKFQADVRALEHKYHTEVYEPLFTKRAQIVNGEYEPTEEETKPADPIDEPTNNPDGDEKGIPDFWLTVMQNNSYVGQSIFEHDEDALRSLRDVKCQNLLPPQQGFVITFHFGENPYFNDATLTKTYYLEEDDTFGELVLAKAEGTKINWKANKNLTVKIVTQKAPGGGKRGGAKGKKGAAARTVKVEEPQDSFFQFFSPPTLNPDDEPGEDDEILENDFEVGCTFKDKLVPFAALWFTGEAADFDDDGLGDFEEEDFDEDEDDEDEEEDDEDEDDTPPPPKGGKGGRGAGGGVAKGPRGAPGHSFAPPGGKGGADQPQQPECKQQ